MCKVDPGQHLTSVLDYLNKVRDDEDEARQLRRDEVNKLTWDDVLSESEDETLRVLRMLRLNYTRMQTTTRVTDL